ncbi:MAG: hypothetical protein KDB53_17330, partial [Planctomycetes bacterium]|nr:hypothetical protein [Planctomycetota bacterium]
MRREVVFGALVLLSVAGLVRSLVGWEVRRAVTVVGVDHFEPVVAEASGEAMAAMASFQMPPGFHAELFAAEPMVAHPVAFHLDGRGGCYVAECFRRRDGGIGDNRYFPEWLDQD